MSQTVSTQAQPQPSETPADKTTTQRRTAAAQSHPSSPTPSLRNPGQASQLAPQRRSSTPATSFLPPRLWSSPLAVSAHAGCLVLHPPPPQSSSSSSYHHHHHQNQHNRAVAAAAAAGLLPPRRTSFHQQTTSAPTASSSPQGHATSAPPAQYHARLGALAALGLASRAGTGNTGTPTTTTNHPTPSSSPHALLSSLPTTVVVEEDNDDYDDDDGACALALGLSSAAAAPRHRSSSSSSAKLRSRGIEEASRGADRPTTISSSSSASLPFSPFSIRLGTDADKERRALSGGGARSNVWMLPGPDGVCVELDKKKPKLPPPPSSPHQRRREGYEAVAM